MKSYTSNGLLNELNSKLTGITASYSNGKLLLTSQVSGSASVISNISGNSISTLFTSVLYSTGTDDIYKTSIQKIPDPNKTCNLQVGANANEFFNVTIDDCSCSNLGIDNVLVDTQDKSKEAITSIDSAISKISSERSKCGAYQNALEHIFNNVSNYDENLTSSESRIEDEDMAKEMMVMSKNTVLEQVSQSLLTQANQIPNRVLDLLK